METQGLEDDWQANFSANLKYTVDSQTIAKLAQNRPMFAPVGLAGSALFFHSNIVHASPPNLSPYPRKMLIITYNSVDNIPISKKTPRPDFIVSRDRTPLQTRSDKDF
jgi:ectoine hydroxylase